MTVISVSESKARFKTLSVFFAIDLTPPASDTPVLPILVLEEVGVLWPGHSPALRIKSVIIIVLVWFK